MTSPSCGCGRTSHVALASILKDVSCMPQCEKTSAAYVETLTFDSTCGLQDLLTRLPRQVQGPPSEFRNTFIEYEDVITG